MLGFALLVFAACVLTVLYWAAVVAVAVILCGFVLAILRAGWWIITRPFVWLIIRPIQFIFGAEQNVAINSNSTAPVPTLTAGANTSIPYSKSAMTVKVEQLDKLKQLKDADVISAIEFEKLKRELLAG